ncbi:pentapeptide repeat protein [Desulfatibacillum aliphaticivorans]|uniref:Pentapeptide repeat protein n=1 Tax=Desulfatibacillum aliphaticivorans TaxID=218208 RepID=B8FEW8_DESAL|nr:pentapeptide repeat protein [Desulfatibacillum aliphaticivorans]
MPQYRKISNEELQQILEQHKLWVESDERKGQCANLQGAELLRVYIGGRDLRGANLSNSYLGGIRLNGVKLQGADFSGAKIGYGVFTHLDLSKAKGLETCSHFGPSSIGIDTIYKSGGNIPEVFLRGCGVPDNFIEYMRSLVGQKLDIYSCFISYSHADEEFAQRLHSALQSCGVRCWYAPHDMQGGKKIYDQIDSAIRVHDKTLLCLSENSMGSKWVETEIRRTRKAMDKTGKQKLFPISIVDDFGRIKEWECFDANTGSDMADEVREFYIPDFSNWKDHDSFQREFEKLLRDLKRDA